MRRSNDARRLALVSTVTAGVVMMSVACGSPAPSGRGAPPARAASSSRAPGAGTTAAQGSTGTSSEVATQAMRAAGASTATTRCHASSLAARAGGSDAGAGQRYASLVFTNKSARTCWLYGFPGLIMIDAKGDVLRTRTRRNGVRPHRITLRPGASARVATHWTVVPTGRETRCPASARLIILPPDEVGAHLEIPFKAAPCDDGRLDVSPMAAGTRL